MKSSSAALLACLLTTALLVLTGAAIQEVGGAARDGTLCPRDSTCTHQFAHDAPAVVNDAIRCAEIAFNRQLTQFERALMIVSGVPPNALH